MVVKSLLKLLWFGAEDDRKIQQREQELEQIEALLTENALLFAPPSHASPGGGMGHGQRRRTEAVAYLLRELTTRLAEAGECTSVRGLCTQASHT